MLGEFDLLKLALTRVEPVLGLQFLSSLGLQEKPQGTAADGRIEAIKQRLERLPEWAKFLLWRSISLIPEATAWRQQLRLTGRDLPNSAETMIGLARLTQVETLGRSVFEDKVEGDFVEAGVWRGGCSIFMRALQLQLGEPHRRVFVVDSFAGLPKPNNGVNADRGSVFHRSRRLAVSRETVEANFRTYGVLDENIVFVEGWFADTLPKLPVRSVALLRIDADMYQSTLDVLDALYDSVARGGFIVIDDYGGIRACRDAVDDFRAARGVIEPIQWVDSTGVHWRKS